MQPLGSGLDGTVGPDNDKTTEYTYGPAGMTSLKAFTTSTASQTTEWVYGFTTGSLINNDIVRETRWPDPTSGAASSGQADAVTINALGQTVTSTDRNGNVHTFSYDVVGRQTDDTVTTLGSGVDGAVRRLKTEYDTQGNAYRFTSTSTSLKVQYAYASIFGKRICSNRNPLNFIQRQPVISPIVELGRPRTLMIGQLLSLF